MKYKFLKLLVILSIVINPLRAQLAEDIKALFDEAKEFMLSEDYTDALYALLELNDIFPSENCDYLIGECYLNIPGRKQQAIPYLESSIQEIDNKYYISENPYEKMAPLRAYYLLGKAYRINNQLDTAIGTFYLLLDYLKTEDVTNRLKVAREIEICNYAKIKMRTPLEIKEHALPKNINNKYANFNATITPDSKYLYYMNAFKFYDGVMYAENVSGEWKNTTNLSPKIGSDGDQYVTDISDDGKTLLLKSFRLLTENDIYFTQQNDDGWTTIDMIKGDINSKFVESHASFSNDSKTIYFSSNRPGGHGGLDIYSAQKMSNGSWSNIKNLGDKINSPYDEDTPFITEDGTTLFFSSKGHNNMGEYDVFISTLENNEWGAPKNIGYPLNTTDDNRFYQPLHNGEKILYSKYDASDPENLNIYIVDSYHKKENTSANENDIPEPTINPYQNKNTSVQKEIKESASETISPKNNTNNVTTEVYTGEKQKEFTQPQKESSATNYKADTIYLANIYFSPEKYYLNAQDIEYLNYLNNKISSYPINNIELNGFSNFGRPGEYGNKLSYYRCVMVRNYFISEGIAAKTFTIEPHIGNQEVNEYNTSNYNRRVEIHIKGLPKSVFIIRTDKILESL